jgi:L-threonylcarbamoyladenylate synthase
VNDLGSTQQRPTERLGASATDLERAAAILRAGGLVAFPTETVYGLGADATDARAVARIYAAKDRPRFNPLIAHLASIDAALAQGQFDEAAQALARAFWPGPLTLVVAASPGCQVSDLARAGLDSVALRVPAHELAQDLIMRVGRPLAAPSANRSGRVSPTDAAHVLADLDGRIDAVIDAGSTEVGLESTIVACLSDGPRLLRPGGVPRERIEDVLGRPLATEPEGDAAPPRARVRLEASEIAAGEAALLFGAEPLSGQDRATAVLNLSESGDLVEAAANLFAHLRALDASGVDTIAVAPIPTHALGDAINDRLRRAAAERA